MIRKCVYAVLSLALVLSTFTFSLASSAYAAELIDTPLQSGIYMRSGVSGTIKYTVPFGAQTKERATPYLGLSLSATKTFSESIGINNRYSVTRSLAEVRFTNHGLRTAKLGGFTMLDEGGNASGDVLSGGTILWVLVVAAVAAGAYLIIDGGSSNNTTATLPGS